MEITVTNQPLFYTFVFIFGLIFGSFLNVCIYRLPKEESIAFPPSHCTSCGSFLKYYHNIPVFSYIFLGGKCHSCGSRISILYPFVELLTAVLLTLLFYKYGITVMTFIYMILILSLIVITFIDLEHMIIPNIITFPGILIGFAYNLIITDWGLFLRVLKHLDLNNIFYIIPRIPALNSFFGILIGGGSLLLIAYLYKLIRKNEGMGMGDVKLLAMLGAFLGINGVFFIILISSLAGSVVGITMILINKGNLKVALPYGPFISLGAILFIFTGGFIILSL
ncbi:MAG: prepilin peptidase [Thermodesulfobacteriota bacterium]